MSSTPVLQPTNAYPNQPTHAYYVATTGEAATVIVIVLFLLFLITLILYLRAKHYPGIVATSSARPPLAFDTNRPSPPLHRPLDPAVLKSIPIAIFRSEDFKEQGGLECAVCLSEFTDGEGARVLPKCKHGFHVECIDMWFASNSTCPLCRLAVAPPPPIKPSVDVALRTDTTLVGEASSSTSVNSSSGKQEKGMLVIEIPGCAVDGLSQSNSPPPVERLGSVRKILSRGSNIFAGACSSAGACDIEQGAAVQLAGEKSTLPVSSSSTSL